MSIREPMVWPGTDMWSWPAVAETVPAARRAVVGFLKQREAGAYGDIALAVSEAVTNAVQHAYGQDGSGTVRLAVERSDDQILIEVSDDGRGVLPRQHSSGLGFGMPLMATLSDGFEVEHPVSGGTRVRIRFRR